MNGGSCTAQLGANDRKAEIPAAYEKAPRFRRKSGQVSPVSSRVRTREKRKGASRETPGIFTRPVGSATL